MGKYGKDLYGNEYTVKPAKPGTSFVAEMREAERKKVEAVGELAGKAVAAMKEGNYDDALVFAQVMCTAVIHASNAVQLAERYGPLLAPHLASDAEVKP